MLNLFQLKLYPQSYLKNHVGRVALSTIIVRLTIIVLIRLLTNRYYYSRVVVQFTWGTTMVNMGYRRV